MNSLARLPAALDPELAGLIDSYTALRQAGGPARPWPLKSARSLLRHPGLAEAVVRRLVRLDEARIAALFGDRGIRRAVHAAR